MFLHFARVMGSSITYDPAKLFSLSYNLLKVPTTKLSKEMGFFVCSMSVGTHCETNIDDCIADVCRNFGTCVDSVNSYSCICVFGFTGQSHNIFCFHLNLIKGSWGQF